MTLIADLLDRDPRGQRLVNNGQARLSDTTKRRTAANCARSSARVDMPMESREFLRVSAVILARRVSRPPGSAASSEAASRTF